MCTEMIEHGFCFALCMKLTSWVDIRLFPEPAVPDSHRIGASGFSCSQALSLPSKVEALITDIKGLPQDEKWQAHAVFM